MNNLTPKNFNSLFLAELAMYVDRPVNHIGRLYKELNKAMNLQAGFICTADYVVWTISKFGILQQAKNHGIS